MVISQLIRVVAASKVDKVRFSETKITLYLLDELSTVNDRLHLQPDTRLTYLTTRKQHVQVDFRLEPKRVD